MWGKQPPKKKPYTPPELGVPNFWGPAPVPPKVYQTWAAIQGEGRDAAGYEDPEGIGEGGAHDSWVSQFSKRFATDPVNIAGEGREGGASSSTEGGDEGDGGSFGTGEGATSSAASNISGEGRDGESSDTEGRNSTANAVNISGEGTEGEGAGATNGLTYGAHDSWVTGFEKELASSTAGSADPTVREQGAGAHDSWVSLFSQHMSSDPFSVSGSGADGSYMASPVQKPAIKPPASIMGQS
jgi:hypothetical protein